MGGVSVTGANLEPISSRSSTPGGNPSLSSTVREEDLRSRGISWRQREDRQTISREGLDGWTTVGDRRGKTRDRMSTSASPPGSNLSPPLKRMNPSSPGRPSSMDIISPNKLKDLELGGEEDEENDVVEVTG